MGRDHSPTPDEVKRKQVLRGSNKQKEPFQDDQPLKTEAAKF